MKLTAMDQRIVSARIDDLNSTVLQVDFPLGQFRDVRFVDIMMQTFPGISRFRDCLPRLRELRAKGWRPANLGVLLELLREPYTYSKRYQLFCLMAPGCLWTDSDQERFLTLESLAGAHGPDLVTVAMLRVQEYNHRTVMDMRWLEPLRLTQHDKFVFVR